MNAAGLSGNGRAWSGRAAEAEWPPNITAELTDMWVAS